MRALALAAWLAGVAACSEATHSRDVDTCTPLGAGNGKACAVRARCQFQGGCPWCSCGDAGWQCAVIPCPLDTEAWRFSSP